MSLVKGRFFKLENDEAIRAKRADGTEKAIVKVNAQGKIELLDVPVVSSDPTEDGALSRKLYVDGKALQVQNFATTGIVQEKSEREAADAAIDARIDSLELDSVTKAYVDTKDQEGKQYADQKVADLVASAPAVLDTLKELSDALGGDENFAATVAGQIGTVDDKVDQEIIDRVAADNLLDARLDVLEADPTTKTYVDAADAELMSDISGEISRAMTAESGLGTRIDGVVSGLSTEITARQTADSALSGRILVLEADPVTKTYVDTWGGNEAQIREAADNTEAQARQAADALIVGRLEILETDPVSKTYVDGKFVEGKGYTDVGVVEAKGYADQKVADLVNGAPAMLDTLKELADAIASQGGSLSDQILNQVGLVDARVTQEISDRQSGDSALQSANNAEAIARQGADSALQSSLVQEIYDRQQGDINLQNSLNSEISTRQNAITGVQSSLTQEISDRQAGDSALNTRVTSLEALVVYGNKELKTLASGDLSYLDCALEAMANSMIVSVSGVMHYEGESYNLSIEGGKTRVTWTGDLASGGAAALISGDKVLLQYMTHVAPSSSGGGSGGGETPPPPPPPPPAGYTVQVITTADFGDKQASQYSTAAGFGVVNLRFETTGSPPFSLYENGISVYGSFNEGASWILQDILVYRPQQFVPFNLGGQPMLVKFVTATGHESIPILVNNF
jgi:hypothetical protein